MEEDGRITEINDMLELMEDILEESRQGFLSSKVQVDKDELFDIIKDVRLRLPNEIQQSKWVVRDRTKILSKAQAEANVIIEEAHHTVDRMVREHDITRQAQEQAEAILSAARFDAREMHLGAVEYADSVMREVEDQLKHALDVIHEEVSDFQDYMGTVLTTVYNNRKELKGVVPEKQPQQQAEQAYEEEYDGMYEDPYDEAYEEAYE